MTAGNMSDRIEQLCRKARDGDTTAASELIMLHHERIFAFLRRLCGNDEDAADLTQRTFARAWSALPSYAGRSSFSTWLHGIARNQHVDWRRKGSRTEAQTDEWWENCAGDGPDPFENAAEREQARRLYALVDKLDDNAREAVHLHYYQGLSLKETAEALELSPSTLKYRLREAVNFLKSKMSESRIS
jgi:RNA polymerase sigma-70 factor (ECF subfamily)